MRVETSSGTHRERVSSRDVCRVIITDDRGDGGSRSRPETEASYGIPTDADGLLPWPFVEEAVAGGMNYWVTTLRPDGRPHARPTWGVWVDSRFHCGGGEGTRWVRNLSADPAIAVHIESAETVVIVEGEAERLDEETAPAEAIERVDEAYEAKYEIEHGTPFFTVRPERVIAWSDYPMDATRWRFDGCGVDVPWRYEPGSHSPIVRRRAGCLPRTEGA